MGKESRTQKLQIPHELNTQMLGEIAMMISDDVPRTEGLCTTAESVRWLRDKLRETNSEVARLRECADRLKNYHQMKSERDEARAEVARLREEALRWFAYVDPSDMYPGDAAAYELWAKEARQNGDL